MGEIENYLKKNEDLRKSEKVPKEKARSVQLSKEEDTPPKKQAVENEVPKNGGLGSVTAPVAGGVSTRYNLRGNH